MRVQIPFLGGPLDADFIECPFEIGWPSELTLVDETGKEVEGRYVLCGEAEASALSEEPVKYVWQGRELLPRE